MAEPDNQKPTYIHDAFISYSRKDKEFARKLDKALKDYRPPKDLNVPQRNLDIFRDEEDFTGVEYHHSLEKHLKDSAKLIVLCSPNSRKSEYVNDEIRQFTETNGEDNIIPVLVSGIPNNEAKPGQEEEMAFPEALCEAMEMPLAADYRSFDLKKDKVNKGIFYGPWYTTLANIYNISRNEIEQREKKRQARRRNITIGVITGVIAALSVLAVWALISRQEAVEQRNIAVARQLAAQSELTRNQRGGLKFSVQLATEAMRRLNSIDVHSLEVDLALRRGLALLPRYVTKFDLGYSDVDAIAFSPDGQRLIAASRYLTAQIWKIASRQEIAGMRGEGVFKKVVLSPDGMYLATADDYGDGGTARVWEVSSGQEIRSFEYEISLNAIALSPNGKYLAISNPRFDRITDQWVKGITSVWDVASGQKIGSLPEFQELSFSPDGKYLATSGIKAGVWEVISSQEGASLKEVPNLKQKGFASAVAFSPDGKYLARASYYDEYIQLWNVNSWQEVGSFKYKGVLMTIALSLGGKYVAVARDDYTIQVWEAASNQEVARIHYGDQIYTVSFSPSGQYLAVGGLNGDVELWEVTGGSDIARIKLGDEVLAVAFSPDEKHLMMADRTGTIINTQIEGVTNDHKVTILKQGQTADSIGFSASGRYLAVSTNDSNVQVWETSGSQKVPNFKYDGVVKAIALSPDGQYLSIATDNGKVHVWKVTNPQEGVSFEYDGVAKAIAVSPGGKYLTAVVGSGKISRAGQLLTARLWKLPKGEEAKSLELGWDLQTDLYSISPDGQYLAVVNGNNVSIRDMESDQIIAIPNQEAPLNDLAFSADGQYLAMAVGSTARVWEVASRTELARIENRSAVKTLFFSPDGKYLATVGQEGEDSENSTLKVWLLWPKDLIAEACSRLSRNLTEYEWKQYVPDEPYSPTCPNLPISKE